MAKLYTYLRVWYLDYEQLKIVNPKIIGNQEKKTVVHQSKTNLKDVYDTKFYNQGLILWSKKKNSQVEPLKYKRG